MCLRGILFGIWVLGISIGVDGKLGMHTSTVLAASETPRPRSNAVGNQQHGFFRCLQCYDANEECCFPGKSPSFVPSCAVDGKCEDPNAVIFDRAVRLVIQMHICILPQLFSSKHMHT